MVSGLTERPGIKTQAERRETRREKSRDAARCRRKNESEAFDDICSILPVPEDVINQLDRSAVIRLLISFIKLRNSIDARPSIAIKDEVDELIPADSEYIKALNGFVMVLSGDCDMMYISSNVKDYIGIPTFDLIGQSVFSFIHEGDHSEITDCFQKDAENTLNFIVRMRSTLTSTGKNINLKSASYKVLKCEGRLEVTENGGQIMILYCEPIPHPANIEHLLDSQTMLSQHSLDMKFTYCDDRTSDLIGYVEEDLLSKSLFDLCHASDIKHLDSVSHKLFRLGQVTTDTYRLLGKYGGYHHVVTQATVINNPKNNKPNYIVCVHYILSQVMEADCIFSLDQMQNKDIRGVVNIKQETEEEENMPINATDSLFSDFDPTQVVYNSTDATLTENILEDVDNLVLALNAPSIGDDFDFDFSSVNVTELGCDEMILNEICKAAPSIGDPPMHAEDESIDTEKLLEWFGKMEEEDIQKANAVDPDMPSTSGAQFVKVPKDMFMEHAALPHVLKRQAEQEKQLAIVNNKRRKLEIEPGENGPPIKKQQFPSLFDKTLDADKSISLDEATKYFLGERAGDSLMFSFSPGGNNLVM